MGLNGALAALAARDFDTAARLADQAIVVAADAAAWRVLALAREGQGDLAAAIEACEAALQYDPASADVLADLGRLALALEAPDAAAQFLAQALALQPASAALAAQLAAALRQADALPAAEAVLRGALEADPASPILWNERGLLALQQGEAEAAAEAFDQAQRVGPGHLESLYNRACAKLDLGDAVGALADAEAALARAPPDRRAAILYTRALARLCLGDLAGGWADFAARLDPDFPRAPQFDAPGRRWTPGEPLAGRRLLVSGEQGLGDEAMFAGLLADAAQALGPNGRLDIAVEPRLVALVARACPDARVGPHATRLQQGGRTRAFPHHGEDADLWAPIGDLAQAFRPDLASFAGRAPALKADPAKVAAWRSALAALGPEPKIGVTWKSMKTGGERRRHYADFVDWRSVLQTPGVRFVDLQYGDSAAEREQARAWGVELWRPPDLDLTNDLDGLAALAVALDLVVGTANATTNIAGACGAPVWILAAPGAWTRLGTDGYPWFADARAFPADRFGAWPAALARLAQALGARFGGAS